MLPFLGRVYAFGHAVCGSNNKLIQLISNYNSNNNYKTIILFIFTGELKQLLMISLGDSDYTRGTHNYNCTTLVL